VQKSGKFLQQQGVWDTMGTSPPHWQALAVPRLIVCPLVLMLGVVLLLLSGGKVTSHGAETGRGQVSTITLTRADSGKVVEARVGDTLVVRLEENPATGYRWTIEKIDEEVIVLHQVEFVPSHSAGMGGGGQRRWTFTAQKAGMVTLELKLWRTWEGDASISERFTVTLHVQE
jgi:inhibitor of cysteine peptidase